MQLTTPTYFRFAKGIGLLVSLMGLGTLGAFVTYLVTGTNPLAADLPGFGGVGLLVMASLGAFALPLGSSLFSAEGGTRSRVRLAASALGLLAVLRLLAYGHPELRSTLGVTPLVEFFVLGGVALAGLWLRPEDEANIELHFDFPMTAPAHAAWAVLGERFADVADWTSSLRASSLEGELGPGAVRTCEVEAFGPFAPTRLTEELLVFEPERTRLTYSARTGLPRIIRAATNRWSIEPVNVQRCRARSHVSLDLRWWALPFAPFLRWSIRSGITRVGGELRYAVEGAWDGCRDEPS